MISPERESAGRFPPEFWLVFLEIQRLVTLDPTGVKRFSQVGGLASGGHLPSIDRDGTCIIVALLYFRNSQKWDELAFQPRNFPLIPMHTSISESTPDCFWNTIAHTLRSHLQMPCDRFCRRTTGHIPISALRFFDRHSLGKVRQKGEMIFLSA